MKDTKTKEVKEELRRLPRLTVTEREVGEMHEMLDAMGGPI